MRQMTKLFGTMALAAGILLSAQNFSFAHEAHAKLIIKNKTGLNLTAEQETKIREIMKRYKDQAEKDREQYKEDRGAMMKAGRDRNEKLDAELEATLTAEQKTKYAELRADLKAKREENRERMKAEKKELKAKAELDKDAAKAEVKASKAEAATAKAEAKAAAKEAKRAAREAKKAAELK